MAQRPSLPVVCAAQEHRRRVSGAEPIRKTKGRAGKEESARYVLLVVRVARQTARRLPADVTFDDVVSNGWVGMLEAIKRRPAALTEDEFEAYASHRVRGAILDNLRMLDPLSRRTRSAGRRIEAAVRGLTARLGREPGATEISNELGISLQSYWDTQRTLEGARPAHAVILREPVSEGPTPELQFVQRELVDCISGLVARLPERMQLVLSLMYRDGRSLREVAERLGVTESRISQMHSAATAKIRALMTGSAVEADAPARGRTRGSKVTPTRATMRPWVSQQTSSSL